MVIGDSTRPKLLNSISQMKSLRTWTTKKVSVIVLLDMSKAFDSMRHDLMLSQLQSIGMSNAACDWFGSYLSQRNWVVKVAPFRLWPTSHDCGRTTRLNSRTSYIFTVCKWSALGPYSLPSNGLCERLQKFCSAFLQIKFQTQLLH